MRPLALTLPALTLLLAGCVAPAPDLTALPHARIVDSHLDTGTNGRIDTFRVLAIDGHNVLPRTDEPARLIGKDASNLMAAGRTVHVEIEGFGFYQNTVRRMFWDPMRAQGTIEFVPAADAQYSVHGRVAPEESSVWIEDDATHAVVASRITVAGHAAAPEDAASAAQ